MFLFFSYSDQNIVKFDFKLNISINLTKFVISVYFFTLTSNVLIVIWKKEEHFALILFCKQSKSKIRIEKFWFSKFDFIMLVQGRKWRSLDEIIIFRAWDLDFQNRRAKIYQKLRRKHNFFLRIHLKKQSNADALYWSLTAPETEINRCVIMHYKWKTL